MKETEFIESYIDNPCTSRSTGFQNVDICSAAEPILGVSKESFPSSAEKLLELFCETCWTSNDIKGHLYSLEAFQNALNGEITRTMFCINIVLRMASILKKSGKEEKQIFFMLDPLEVTMAQIRLA